MIFLIYSRPRVKTNEKGCKKMSNIIDNNNHKSEITGKIVGTVSVSMYKDTQTGLPLFHVEAENDDVLQLSYIIEDILEYF